MRDKSTHFVAADMAVLALIAFGTLLYRYGLAWPTGLGNVDAVPSSRGVWVIATSVFVALAVGTGAILGLYKQLSLGQTALRAFGAITLACAMFTGLGVVLFSLGMQWPTSVINMGILIVLGTPAVFCVHWALATGSGMVLRRRVLLFPAILAVLATTAAIGPLYDSEVLAEGLDDRGRWIVTATAWVTGALSIRTAYDDGSAGGVTSGFANPPTLNEAGTWGLADETSTFTLITGPVGGDVRSVEVATTDGQRLDGQLRQVARSWLFVARADGLVGIADIVARDRSGDVVDRWTLPNSPPAWPFGSAPELEPGEERPPRQ